MSNSSSITVDTSAGWQAEVQTAASIVMFIFPVVAGLVASVVAYYKKESIVAAVKGTTTSASAATQAAHTTLLQSLAGEITKLGSALAEYSAAAPVAASPALLAPVAAPAVAKSATV